MLNLLIDELIIYKTGKKLHKEEGKVKQRNKGTSQEWIEGNKDGPIRILYNGLFPCKTTSPHSQQIIANWEGWSIKHGNHSIKIIKLII